MAEGRVDSARQKHDVMSNYSDINASLTDVRAALGPRYRIERAIGRGASAMVYLAHDEVRDTAVAVKVLHEELTAAVSIARFVREVDIGQRLQHPNIVPVFESGTAKERAWYTMPFVEGQSLRERLERQRQLSIEEAITIATQIASALDYAHERGVIHRDIKPGNILLASSGAMVADFGIARAMIVASGETFTDSGIAIGTPEYMSPEQAGGERNVDGRTDIYGLGCVMYQMLAGEPPFTGPTAQAIIARHFHEAPRSIRVVRPSVSPAIERAILRALAKVPADRFLTGAEFIAALSAPDVATRADVKIERERAVKRSRRFKYASAGVALAALGLWGATRSEALMRSVGLGGVPLDSMKFVVLPLDVGADSSGGGAGTGGASSGNTTASAASGVSDVVARLREGFSSWREFRVANSQDVAAAVRRYKKSDLTAEQNAQRVAERLGAGRYVRAQLERVGDSTDVSVSLFETRSDSVVATARLRIRSDDKAASAATTSLADSVLFHGEVPRFIRTETNRGTPSVSARRAFLRGQLAIEDGSFARADSQFSIATREDPSYPQALLWSALVRSWFYSTDLPWNQLLQQATRAGKERNALSQADSMMLFALSAQATKTFDVACATWERTTVTTPSDFVAWYSLANCLRRDPAVLRETNRPSHWKFRASREQSVRAFERAFALRPALLGGNGASSLIALQAMFATTSARTRDGKSVLPDNIEFGANPVWDHDTLAYVPFPRAAALLATPPRSVALAIQKQRERLKAVVRAWRDAYPRSAEAVEAVAVTLDMLGDSAALDTMRIAQSLTNSAPAKLRIAAGEVLLRAKFAIPGDLGALRSAVKTADSLLAEHPPTEGSEPRLLGSLAALLGRARLAASYAVAGGIGDPAPPIAQSGPALVAYASLGGPTDSLRNLEQRLETDLLAMPEANRNEERARWLWRSVTLAYPDFALRALNQPEASQMPGVSMAVAAVKHDTNAVNRELEFLSRVRQPVRRADVVLDGLFPEAAVLAAMGDAQRAIDWLDPTLVALRHSNSSDLGQIPRAGSLARAMVLRATLAERVGDRATASRWASAVVVLWSTADEFLQQTVRKMEKLAR